MATLLLRLAGPMQSWGTASRFTERDSGREPSKSGVLGLLAAALGVDRHDWEGSDLPSLAHLRLGVRHDRPGVPKNDYQTAGAGSGMIKADGGWSKDGVVSHRDYLSDAVFLAGLETEDRSLLERCHAALADPYWPLYLGRRSYVPSEPIWLKDGLRDEPLETALSLYPLRDRDKSAIRPGAKLLLSLENDRDEGRMCMDVPLAAFSERHFGARFVISKMVGAPDNADDAAKV